MLIVCLGGFYLSPTSAAVGEVSVRVGESITLSLTRGVDYNCNLNDLIAAWQETNDNVALAPGTTEAKITVIGRKVGVATVKCTYWESYYDPNVGSYVPGVAKIKSWIVDVTEDGENIGDEGYEEDATIYYTDPELHLLFTLDKFSKEAILGNNVDEKEAAISFPPIGDDWWKNPTYEWWENIVVPSTITYLGEEYTVVGVSQNAFRKTNLVHSITLPETIRTIGADAFNSCVKLESVNIPSQVRYIPPRAFQLCHMGLKKIQLPEGLDSIGGSAFSECLNLEEINIPKNCKKIGVDAFTWCRKLSKLIIDDSENELECSYSYKVSELYYDADFYGGGPKYRGQFADCSLSTIHMGRNIVFPESPDGTGNCLPFNCDGADSFFSGYSTTFGWMAKITFGPNVTEIADYMFSNMKFLNVVSLPSKLKAIGENAFNSNMGSNSYYVLSQKELTIPESVESIGTGAFGNNILEKVNIPNGLTRIESGAFASNELKEINIPASVEFIGEGAFASNELKEIDIPASVEFIGDGAFAGNSLKYVYCNGITPPSGSYPFADAAIFVQTGKGKEYRQRWPGALIIDTSDDVISINVRTAGTLYSRLLAQDLQNRDVYKLKLKGIINNDDIAVINGMDNLYYLDLTEMQIEEIPAGLFQSIPKLVNIKLPLTLTTIHDEEFANCPRLTGNIQLPTSCTTIGNNAFSNTGIDGITYTGAINFGEYAFANCYRLSNLDVTPNSSVGRNAFQGTQIVKTNIGEGVTIGSDAFLNSCLSEVVLEAGVEKIEDGAFGTALQKITIEGNVDSIGNIFTNSILEVYVSDIATWCKLPFNDGGPMKYSPKLYINGEEVNNVDIPQTVDIIRNYLFLNCQSLSSVIIPKGIKAIGNNAFQGCSILTSISLPSTLTTIGENAFNNCRELASITLPSNLTVIGENAFSECSKMETINFPSTLNEINAGAFYGCFSLAKIDLPSSITSVKTGAFDGCSGLQRVVVHWDEPITIQKVFTGKPSDCFLYCPIGTATKYYQAGWDEFSNLKEAGIMSIKANSGGTVSCYDTNITDKTDDVFFTPYKSFYVNFTPNEGYIVKKIKLNDENVTSQQENGKLFIEEPEENMTLSVFFADTSIQDGDVNGDKRINEEDACKTAKHIIKDTPQDFYDYWADVNNDNKIDITDIIIIIAKYLNKE